MARPRRRAVSPGRGWACRWTRRPRSIGEAEVLREGDDVAILALGSMVAPAVEAARLEARRRAGRGGERSLLQTAGPHKLILSLAARAGRIVTVEEHALMGGFGSAVLECLAEAGLANVRVKRLGVPDRFIEHATRRAAGPVRA